MNIKEKFSKRIKEIRLKKKITQEQLSELSGLDRTFVSHIEGGKRNVSIETLDALCKGLGITARYFFNSDYFNE